uniref:polyketide synthase dehydratase domain-containing protein n=1 Tax=Streptomyces sp. NRRL S-920 TaxID=1463921 RepID=UPI0005612888
LRVSHAFHSPRMEPMLDEFRTIASGLTYGTPSIPVVSNLTGTLATPEDLCTADYWVRHVRQAVRFADGITYLAEQGVTSFIELGPDGTLSAMAQETLTDADTAAFTPVLRKNRPEPDTFTQAVTQAHIRGRDLDWDGVFAGRGAQRVDLPTYAFQHERYWLDMPAPGGDTVLVPGTGLVELAIHAGDQVGCGSLEELTLQAPLVLPEHGGVALRVAVEAADEGGRRSVAIYSRRDDAEPDTPWTLHAVGSLNDTAPVASPELSVWPPKGAEAVELDGLYADLAAVGLSYGPVFQGLRAAWRLGDDVYAEVALPEGTSTDGFGLHPALLDAALHA